MASVQAPAERGIEKCGYLKIKRPPISGKVRIKAWQSKYFVLRDLPPTFEYFKDEFAFSALQQTKEKNKINLDNVIHIGTTDASRTQRNAFMIVDTHHGAIMLATDSEQQTKEWVDALNRVSGKSGSLGDLPANVGHFVYPDPQSPTIHSPLQSPRLPITPPWNSLTSESGWTPSPIGETSQGFPVTTRLTPSSEKIGIRDDYIMYITDEYVAIHDVDTKVLVVQWPIVGLRGWKSEGAESAGRRGTQLLTLEAGRKSATGEGLFQFFTDFGEHIAIKIRVHSNVLFASAVEKRKTFPKHRSDSSEELPRDKPTQSFHKSTATDPRPITAFKAIIPARAIMASRADSDALIFDKHQRQKSSPSSLRRELLVDSLSKELNKDKQPESLGEGSQLPTADNTYLDLINDTNAHPVHIPDSDHRRKSLDSSSQNSDEEIIMQRTSMNAANEINDCHSAESYIDDSEINMYNENKSKVVKDCKENVVEEKNVDTEIYSDPSRIKSFEPQKTVHNTPQLCEDFLAQLSNPQAHQGNIFPRQEKQTSSSQIQESASQDVRTELAPSQPLGGNKLAEKSIKSTNVVEKDIVTCPTKDNDCTNINNQSETEFKKSTLILPSEESDLSSANASKDFIGQSQCFEESMTSELIANRKPRNMSYHGEKGVNRLLPQGKEEAMDLLEKLVSNLETPQTCTQERIFPPLSKRNGSENVEKSFLTKSEAPQSDTHTRQTEMAPKKTIEKSKSHCGFDNKLLAKKPPPLPVRPEMIPHARTKPSASLGDLSKDLHRPLEFPKEIHRHLSPLGSHTPAFGVPWGPESVVHARLLHRSTSGSSLGPVRETLVTQHSIHDSERTTKTEAFDKPRTRSVRGSIDSSSINLDNEHIPDDDFDSKKRRTSKASKIFSRVFNSLNPADSKRRASCDIVSNGGLKEFDAAKRGRSSSVAPGIINEGWSPEQSLDVPSPEGSPQNIRKSQSAGRRLSYDPTVDRKRNFFISSPTFENRTKEEMRLRERARERERERSELPSEPPPQLPPRKKSDPPPLPPRIRKTSSDSSGPSSPKCNLPSQEQPGLSTAEKQTCSGDSTPPPIPPRRDDRRGSQPPAIQFTTSSPEEKPLESSLDRLAEETPQSPTASASSFKQPNDDLIARAQPCSVSSAHNIDSSVSCPIPKRPPKIQGHRTSQQDSQVDEENAGSRDSSFQSTEIRNSELRDRVSFFERTKGSFVSIEMQERNHTETSDIVHTSQRTHEERLEIYDIERDSVDASPSNLSISGQHPRHPGPVETSSQASASPKTNHRTLSPQQSSGSSGRCSPGHTPPLLNLSSRSGGIVLGDSPTTPISV